MATLRTTTKGKIGLKAARGAVKHPGLVRIGGRLGYKVGRPIAKRRLQQGAQRATDTARSIAEIAVVYGPQLAYAIGLAEPPKPKRTAPRVAAGIVIGAGAMYFFEPQHGHEHRAKLAQAVS